MLELDDVQHFLVSRSPALAARYEFVSFPNPRSGHAWLSTVMEKIGTAKAVAADSANARWISVAFSRNGLRAFGVNEDALASFPEEFRLGLAARATMLGATGKSVPEARMGRR